MVVTKVGRRVTSGCSRWVSFYLPGVVKYCPKAGPRWKLAMCEAGETLGKLWGGQGLLKFSSGLLPGGKSKVSCPMTFLLESFLFCHEGPVVRIASGAAWS